MEEDSSRLPEGKQGPTSFDFECGKVPLPKFSGGSHSELGNRQMFELEFPPGIFSGNNAKVGDIPWSVSYVVAVVCFLQYNFVLINI